MAKKLGRRPKLDDVMIKRICGQVKKGNFAKQACAAVGISASIFYHWKQLGEIDRAATPPKRSKYSDFLDALDHAEGVSQQRLVRKVIELGGWKGHLEILQRRFPKEWGNRQTLSSGRDGNPLPEAPTPGGAQVNLFFRTIGTPTPNPFIDEENPDNEPETETT